MSTWVVVLLGVIALGSAVQTGFMIWLALCGLRVGRWVQARQEEIAGQLAEANHNVERVRRNLAEVRDIYEREDQRTRAAASRLTDRARQTREELAPVVENLRMAASLWRAGRDLLRLLRHQGA
jgi:hypothetical protein